MATCEDCIHEKVCGYYAEFEDEADDCTHFKNKADVVEVRHAHWEYNRHQAPHEKSYFCSLCAEGESDYGMDKYCSHCGARMDGERRDT